MNKEQKATLKLIEKQVQSVFKANAKTIGYRYSSTSLYCKIENYFIHSIWFIRFLEGQYQLVLRPCIKQYDYDSQFWEIFNMEENEKQKDSFRANGAFVAPSVQWTELIYNITENDAMDEFVNAVLNDFGKACHLIISKIASEFSDFDSYVLSLTGIMDESLLKMLAYVNTSRYTEALELAQSEIAQGRLGRFENKGIGINEYVVQFCKKKM